MNEQTSYISAESNSRFSYKELTGVFLWGCVIAVIVALDFIAHKILGNWCH